MTLNKKLLITGLFFVALSPATWALSDDACRDRNGLAIRSQECNEYFKANRGMSDAECFKSSECRQQKEAAAQVRRERQEQEKAAQQEAIERAEAGRVKRATAVTSAQKQQCGDDYKTPRIGMTIDRVKECVTSVKLTAQINRADGIVSTYQGGGAYFHVMDGRVVSWGR